MKDKNVGFAFSSYYFDIEDYASPIKPKIGDLNYIPILSNFNSQVDTLMKLNEVSDANGYVFDNNMTEYNFFEVGNTNLNLYTDTNTSTLFEVHIKLDISYTNIERRVYSIQEMIGQVGGSISTILYLFSMLVLTFAPNAYRSSLVSEFYHSSTEIMSDKDKTDKPKRCKFDDVEEFDTPKPVVDTQMSDVSMKNFVFQKLTQSEAILESI